MAAQGAQFAAQCDDALISRDRVLAGGARVADRVGQARRVGFDVGRIGRPANQLRDRLGRGQLGRSAPAERQRAPPQCGQVAAAEPPARTGEDPHGRSSGRRVGDEAQHGHHVGDFGDGEQACQPDDLDGNSSGPQRICDRCGVGVAADQHGTGGRVHAVGPGLLVVAVKVLGDPFTFGLRIGKQRAADRSG